MPAGTEATLTLPAVSANAVREGRTPLAAVDGVRLEGSRGRTGDAPRRRRGGTG
ncbi:hypothetical protein [Streptomyces sp. KL116D]|uniref:hypothetical protein n=1 Tax=Streptomyces sp. KL116D TaxID=3045152 RepID=UPI00355776A3